MFSDEARMSAYSINFLPLIVIELGQTWGLEQKTLCITSGFRGLHSSNLRNSLICADFNLIPVGMIDFNRYSCVSAVR